MTATATLPKQSASFDYICKTVQSRSAIVLEPSKAYLVESRLAPILRDQGFASLDELAAAMREPRGRLLIEQVVEAMTTNETSFFRDMSPFDALKTHVIPELAAKRSRERQLNIWSAASSSGQELYTIAITLREHFAVLQNWGLRLIGTDLSKQMVERAKAGVFNQTEVNRGLPAPLLVKYFQREGMQWRLKDDVRKMAEFREMNLIETWPASLPKMDVIFMRNVLIYFTPEVKKQLLAKARALMKPDGYLFLGAAETTMNLDTEFERVTLGKTVGYRIKGAAS